MTRADFRQQQEDEERLAREFAELPESIRQSLLLSYEIRAKINYHKRMVRSLELDHQLLFEGKPLDWGIVDGKEENTIIT